jgi:hypothetical protein
MIAVYMDEEDFELHRYDWFESIKLLTFLYIAKSGIFLNQTTIFINNVIMN